MYNINVCIGYKLFQYAHTYIFFRAFNLKETFFDNDRVNFEGVTRHLSRL